MQSEIANLFIIKELCKTRENRLFPTNNFAIDFVAFSEGEFS